jgi:hypothetical protein
MTSHVCKQMSNFANSSFIQQGAQPGRMVLMKKPDGRKSRDTDA